MGFADSFSYESTESGNNMSAETTAAAALPEIRPPEKLNILNLLTVPDDVGFLDQKATDPRKPPTLFRNRYSERISPLPVCDQMRDCDPTGAHPPSH
jgi:hypothetical protein